MISKSEASEIARRVQLKHISTTHGEKLNEAITKAAEEGRFTVTFSVPERDLVGLENFVHFKGYRTEALGSFILLGDAFIEVKISWS